MEPDQIGSAPVFLKSGFFDLDRGLSTSSRLSSAKQMQSAYSNQDLLRDDLMSSSTSPNASPKTSPNVSPRSSGLGSQARGDRSSSSR